MCGEVHRQKPPEMTPLAQSRCLVTLTAMLKSPSQLNEAAEFTPSTFGATSCFSDWSFRTSHYLPSPGLPLPVPEVAAGVAEAGAPVQPASGSDQA